MPRDRLSVGRLGEGIAAEFLARRGALVLARNVVTSDGEVDLIVAFGDEVAAVEVRTARRSDIAPDLMSLRKQQQMRRVAAGLDPPVFRIDLVTVLMQQGGVRVRWHPRL